VEGGREEEEGEGRKGGRTGGRACRSKSKLESQRREGKRVKRLEGGKGGREEGKVVRDRV